MVRAIGCMRLSTDPARDSQRAMSTLLEALAAGVRFFDTADSYALDASEPHHNERMIADALAAWGGPRQEVTVATKVGIVRTANGGWIPKGGADHLYASAEQSRTVLGTLDRVQLHVVDPAVPFKSSLKGLRRILDAGIARTIGLSNVRVAELEQAVDLLPIASVQIELSPLVDGAVRGGIVGTCIDRGIDVLAYRPFGGAKRARSLLRDPVVVAIAAGLGVAESTVVLSWLEGFGVVPLPGPSRPQTAAACGARTAIEPADLRALDDRFPWSRLLRAPWIERRPERGSSEVAIVMGSPASGKTTVALARGGVRLNRDERGGTLRGLLGEMTVAIRGGAEQIVLDNTYPTRAQRNEVIDAAWQAGAYVRCVLVDTSIEDAQANAIHRMLQRYDRLLEPHEIKSAPEANTFGPNVLFRWAAEYEAPTASEGFEGVDAIAFRRAPDPACTNAAVLVDLDAAGKDRVEQVIDRWPDRIVLGQGWMPGASPEQAAAARAALLAACPRLTDVAFCTHGAGPPVCWCRKPIAGLGLLLFRRHGVDPSQSYFVGRTALDRTLARRLGSTFVEFEPDDA
jgi:aryl-alcohol dehydrogenase-like predicted oxidoreductase